MIATAGFFNNAAAQDSTAVTTKNNTFTVDASILVRGEVRHGALDDNEQNAYNEEEKLGPQTARFIQERTRLSFGYSRPHLELKVTGQHSGVWGQSDGGSLSVFEAWVKLTANNGLFAQIGRQTISYDDERVLGANDFTMAGYSHDVLKVGFENDRHKIHAIVGFNQNDENTNGGTYYADGGRPYKTMQTLWYHFDPTTTFGASFLFMNLGVQNTTMIDAEKENKTEYQQMVGTYLKWQPQRLTAEFSYYYQMGINPEGLKLRAWMTSIETRYRLDRWELGAGYYYMSGDKWFAVPPGGDIGLAQHTVMRGFSPVYGSHHKFYGAMDFFYLKTFVASSSPGLQDAHVNAVFKPIDKLSLMTAYHFMAITANLESVGKPLGHEIELGASFQILKDVNLTAGYSFMHGTENMVKLKRTSHQRNLHWAWLSISFTPRIFSAKF